MTQVQTAALEKIRADIERRAKKFTVNELREAVVGCSIVDVRGNDIYCADADHAYRLNVQKVTINTL